MDAQEIINKLTYYYEEQMKDDPFYQQSKDNEILNIKLLQTTNLFVRSFDYELPKGHTIISKLNMFIHRVIRRCTRFITSPYADKMQRYNESVCELLGQMIQHFGEKNQFLVKQNENMSTKLAEYKSIIEEHKKSLEHHEECISELQKHYEDSISELQKHYEDSISELRMTVENLNSKLNFDEKKEDIESFSQAGEDKIVNFLLNYGGGWKKSISYLDIGCNHYRVLNNSYNFYKKGYRGVLVEANPNFIEELKRYRPGDVVLNIGCGGSNKEEMIFYIVNNVDLSSFDRSSIEAAQKESPWLEIVEEVKVPVLTINDIIERYCNGVPTVVSLDVEGIEMDILQNLDFQKYRPAVFIIETISYAASIQIGKKRMDIIDFMAKQGYGEFAFTGVNSIFVDLKQFS